MASCALKGFAEGYRAIANGGWVSTSAGLNGGMGLPLTVTTAVNEMMAGACWLAAQSADDAGSDRGA